MRVIRGDFPGRLLVELQLHGSPITSAYTDEEGKFGFGQLTTNQYVIVMHDPRFLPVDERVNLDLSVSATQIISINLTRRDTTQTTNPSPQKGSNPYIIDTKEYRSRFPKNAVKEFDRGVKADQNGKREEAISHYQNAVRLAPDFYPAHNNLGTDFLAESNLADAQSQFEQAIKLNQSDADSHLNLANVYLMKRDYPQALSSVQEGLKRSPNSAFGQFLLGSIYKGLGKLTDAEHALHEALQIDPSMSRVHLELVNLYLSQRKKSEASLELKAFLKDSPNDPLAAKAREMLDKLDANP